MEYIANLKEILHNKNNKIKKQKYQISYQYKNKGKKIKFL